MGRPEANRETAIVRVDRVCCQPPPPKKTAHQNINIKTNSQASARKCPQTYVTIRSVCSIHCYCVWVKMFPICIRYEYSIHTQCSHIYQYAFRLPYYLMLLDIHCVPFLGFRFLFAVSHQSHKAARRKDDKTHTFNRLQVLDMLCVT